MAIIARHDRPGPQYVSIECIGQDFTCPASERVDASVGTTDAQIFAGPVARGWSLRPTLCPKHAAAAELARGEQITI